MDYEWIPSLNKLALMCYQDKENDLVEKEVDVVEAMMVCTENCKVLLHFYLR